MPWGRVLSSSAAVLAVAGGVVVVVGLSRETGSPSASRPRPAATHATIPATLRFPHTTPAPSRAPVTSRAGAATHGRVSAVAISPARVTPPAQPAVTVVAPATVNPISTSAAQARTATTVAPAPVAHTPVAPAPVRRTSTAPVPASAPVASRGGKLPLRFATGTATRVITVTAPSTGSTVATLQAWTRVSGGWKRWGSAITAHIGADGMSTHATESRSATPIGSFTLTQAFGRNADPGTGLPYFRTTPADYWISDEGPLYNTHRRCPSSNAGCHDDGVNERLYYETPYYRYAVVIDYNTRNAPGGVKAGRGSAFFLHVTDGTPTAGCVAIDQQRLVTIMRWLRPSAHPRILIGTT